MKGTVSSSMPEKEGNALPFLGHLEVLRRMLFRVLAVVTVLAVVIFCFKDFTFRLLLAPGRWDFVTYRCIERFLHRVGSDFCFTPFDVKLIATELSSQFMTHLSVSLYLGLLAASPYILMELFRFVAPALYAHERKYAVRIALIVFVLFLLGVLMSYFVLFPVAFRFLGTYSVAENVESTITLHSYVSTFTTLTFVLGLVFQLPVVALFLGKAGLIRSETMARYRKHAIVVLLLMSAMITPPDLMTLLLVALPLYLLYEFSRVVLKRVELKTEKG